MQFDPAVIVMNATTTAAVIVALILLPKWCMNNIFLSLVVMVGGIVIYMGKVQDERTLAGFRNSIDKMNQNLVKIQEELTSWRNECD